MSPQTNRVSPIDIVLEEASGIPRICEPVTMGVPFAKGILRDPSSLSLLDEEDHQIPLQTLVTDLWSDGSIRWLLIDFQAAVNANTASLWHLEQREGGLPCVSEVSVSVSETSDVIIVDSGEAVFHLDLSDFKPIRKVRLNGLDIIDPDRTGVILRDDRGEGFVPVVKRFSVETKGPLRSTVFFSGSFKNKNKELADFFSRVHFYAGHSLTKIEFTVRNSRAAKHRGGLWDLGDEGSVYFKDLSLKVGMITDREVFADWKTQVADAANVSHKSDVCIYQDSSGGENWDSRNHINRFGKMTTSFRGYRVYEDGRIIEEGNRANPVLCIGANQRKVVAAIAGVWQNFPSGLESRGGVLTAGLFPGRFSDLFELQAGEQKTRSAILSFSGGDNQPNIDWVYSPIIPGLSPEYYSGTGVFSYLTPRKDDIHAGYSSMMDSIIDGETSFFNRREIIDEYGWRNFGDLYADHENMYYSGPKPVISHYNNQYDALYGFLLHYARSGDQRWFKLADDLARHVMDIDIYHTGKDKAAYNGGLFWHTDHYADAATSTHRTYSRKTMDARGLKDYGGGPSNEHNYTTGLLYYYFMTGNQTAKESVAGLADWVINMDDGSKSPFRFLCRSATGLASQTGSPYYHKPGRGCGNSINALIDGFILTGNRSYLDKAEELIRRCIHPKDDIDSLNLVEDPEHRWYYTAFLQVLGRYLDFKTERAEADHMYCYARESLLHYARWMAENELPFKQILDRVEYPTETWIVMDMRKSNVFDYASKYADDESLRKQFSEKAAFFYNTCLKDLDAFETKTLTRPLVVMMSYGTMRSYFHRHPDVQLSDRHCPQHDFGPCRQFISQRAMVKNAVPLKQIYMHWLKQNIKIAE